MAEWTIAAVLKTAERREVFRGFKSHSLRHSQMPYSWAFLQIEPDH